MFFAALLSIICGFPTLHFDLWNDDGLTRFFKVLISLGTLLASWMQKIFFPKFYLKESLAQLSKNFLLIYSLLTLSVLCVSAKTPFLISVFIVLLMLFLMIGSLYCSDRDCFNSTWNIFRIIICILIVILFNLVFYQHFTQKVALSTISESGRISILGITFAIGMFPLPLIYEELIEKSPTFLAALYTFIIPIPVLMLYIRLLNLYPFARYSDFIVLLCLVTIAYSIVGEYVSHRITPIKSVSMLVGCVVLSIMLPMHSNVYLACLFLMSLVIYAPLCVMIDRSSDDNQNDLVGWLYLALSGFPPIGIFWPCFLLIFNWSNQTFFPACILFLMLIIRGNVFFYKLRSSFLSLDLKSKEVRFVWYCLVIQTIILPLCFSDWIWNLFKFSLPIQGLG